MIRKIIIIIIMFILSLGIVFSLDEQYSGDTTIVSYTENINSESTSNNIDTKNSSTTSKNLEIKNIKINEQNPNVESKPSSLNNNFQTTTQINNIENKNMSFSTPIQVGDTKISSGWRLITFTGLDKTKVLTENTFKSDEIITIWAWDNSIRQHYFYTPTLNFQDNEKYTNQKGYLNLKEIKPNTGYWINAKKPFIINLNTERKNTYSNVELKTGWNLIGFSYITQGKKIPIEEFLNNLNLDKNKIITIWTFKDSYWYFYSPSLSYLENKDYAINKGYLLLTEIDSEQGYWINYNGEATNLNYEIYSIKKEELVKEYLFAIGLNQYSTGETYKTCTKNNIFLEDCRKIVLGNKDGKTLFMDLLNENYPIEKLLDKEMIRIVYTNPDYTQTRELLNYLANEPSWYPNYNTSSKLILKNYITNNCGLITNEKICEQTSKFCTVKKDSKWFGLIKKFNSCIALEKNEIINSTEFNLNPPNLGSTEISQGWTLITFTGLDTSINLEKNPFNTKEINSIWAWDNSLGQHYFYSPILSYEENLKYTNQKGYLDLKVIKPNTGYWINTNNAIKLNYDFNELSYSNIELKKGWNLVGFSYISPEKKIPIEEFLFSTNLNGNKTQSIWTFKNNQWYFYSSTMNYQENLNYAKNKGYMLLSEINSEQGYWINYNGEATNLNYKIYTKTLSRTPLEPTVSPSIFTYFDSIENYSVNGDIVEASIEIKIDTLPTDIKATDLYFWSLVLQFSDSSNPYCKNAWGHIGLQWASNAKKANWGGGGNGDGSENYGCANSVESLKLFNWEIGKKYIYTVKRGNKNSNGDYLWEGRIKDINSNLDISLGSLLGGSTILFNAPGYNNPHVMTETGYGVNCNAKSRVIWKSLQLITDKGEKIPINFVSTYSGCNNTNQKIISSNTVKYTSDAIWTHETSIMRESKDYSKIITTIPVVSNYNLKECNKYDEKQCIEKNSECKANYNISNGIKGEVKTYTNCESIESVNYRSDSQIKVNCDNYNEKQCIENQKVCISNYDISNGIKGEKKEFSRCSNNNNI